jgi:hypothetical protein
VAVLLNSHGGDTPPKNPAPPPPIWVGGGLWNPKLDPPDHLLQRYPNPLGTPRHLHRVELQGLMVEGVQVGYRRSGTHLMTIATEPPPDHPADPRHLTASLCWASGGRLVLAPDTELVWRGATHLGVDTQREGPGGMLFPPTIRTPKTSTSVCNPCGEVSSNTHKHPPVQPPAQRPHKSPSELYPTDVPVG